VISRLEFFKLRSEVILDNIHMEMGGFVLNYRIRHIIQVMGKESKGQSRTEC
jgi:hypothetical protein